LPKFAAGNREKGTADENKAVVAAVISHIGRYTWTRRTIPHVPLESSTYPLGGTAQKRPFTVSGDELKYTMPLLSGGGRADLVWKRIK